MIGGTQNLGEVKRKVKAKQNEYTEETLDEMK